MRALLRVTSGAIEMSWDPEARLAVIQFETETRATGKDAAVMIDALTRWTGIEPKAFGLLGDGGKLRGVDAEYRSLWATFFKARRDYAYVAFFNMGPLIRIAAEMFRIGTGVRVKAFAGEAEARSWLRESGIAA